MLELFGVEGEEDVLEFGVVGDDGEVGEVDEVGDLGEVGEFDDDGVFDLTELRLLGCVAVLGDVADDELLLLGVDCAPGAIDMRGPRCAPLDVELDELDELLEDD